MNIIALDLATRTGWAALVTGDRFSGVADFSKRPHEPPGWRFIRFNHWLHNFPATFGHFDLVVYEKPISGKIGFTNIGTTEVAIGFATRVQEYAARVSIPFEAVHLSTLKKWATGNGHADKLAMMSVAQIIVGKRNKRIVDDNEADAICLLEYAVGHFTKKEKAHDDGEASTHGETGRTRGARSAAAR